MPRAARLPRRTTMVLSLAALAMPIESQAGGDVALGEYLSGSCVTCHRKDGSDKGIPPIVGWPDDQFIAVMTAYKAKMRDHPVMQSIAGNLADDDIKALAAYFATLKPPN